MKNTLIITVISILGISTFLGLLVFFLDQKSLANNPNKTYALSVSSSSQATSQDNSQPQLSEVKTQISKVDPIFSSKVTTIPKTSAYKDGDYSAAQGYVIGRAQNEVRVKLVLKDSIITELTNQYTSEDYESMGYNNNFDSEISGKVLNKKISDINLSRVGGASLTTTAFMQAVSSIQNQAK